MNFSERLKKLIKDKSLSYKDIEDQTGIPQSNVSHYANGHREPDLEKTAKLAKTLGVSVDYLINGQNTINGNNSVISTGTDSPVNIHSTPHNAIDQQIIDLLKYAPEAMKEELINTLTHFKEMSDKFKTK